MIHITYTDEYEYMTNSEARLLLTENDKLIKSALRNPMLKTEKLNAVKTR